MVLTTSPRITFLYDAFTYSPCVRLHIVKIDKSPAAGPFLVFTSAKKAIEDTSIKEISPFIACNTQNCRVGPPFHSKISCYCKSAFMPFSCSQLAFLARESFIK